MAIMQKNTYPGKFIVFEGLDGSGQSTQAALLRDFLVENGHDVVLTKEPTKDSEAGKKIRDVLNKNTWVAPVYLQELFAQDRKEHLDKVIISALKDGKIVISDRYFFTSFAYGAAEGIDMEYLVKINDNYLMPDVTFFLKVAPEVCLKRIEERGTKIEFFERLDHFRKAEKNFESLTKSFNDFYILDGEKSIQEAHEDVKKLWTGR